MRGLRRGRGGSGRRRGGNGSRSCTSAHTARWLSRMLCLVQLLPVAMLFLQQACCDDLAGTPRQTLGLLFCNGSRVHSEVIYWRQVYADLEYISPIAPKTSRMQHQYITFDWDRAGMFNVLMVHENIPVIAHALGRTLVLPPETQLFHQDRGEGVGWKGVATKYEDLFDVDMLKRQRGLRVIGMEEFLEKEAVTGRLRDGRVPPSNSSRVREKALYDYLNETADERPTFGHSEHDRRDFYVALPGRWAPSDYRLKTLRRREQQRLAAFAGDRVPQFYDAPLRSAKHLHIPYWPPPFRILDHFYAYSVLRPCTQLPAGGGGCSVVLLLCLCCAFVVLLLWDGAQSKLRGGADLFCRAFVVGWGTEQVEGGRLCSVVLLLGDGAQSKVMAAQGSPHLGCCKEQTSNIGYLSCDGYTSRNLGWLRDCVTVSLCHCVTAHLRGFVAARPGT
eukprot:352891-Chlamydomonas_euryale.AAC.9